MFNWLFKKKSVPLVPIYSEELTQEQINIYAENVWESKIKVGSVVVIRTDIKDGDKPGQFTFRHYMEKYKGMKATVTSKTEPRRKEKLSEILIDLDGGVNYWDVTMFKSVN